jgi:predicted Zn-dependent protease
MNANELADKLISSLTMEYDCDKYMEQAATMLRQQQAEIEALKAQVLAWENAEIPVEVMADIIVELEKRGFLEKTEKAQATMDVMSEHCTCYKLGYSQLNDYAKVKAK